MFGLPELPYAYDALSPTISANTMHLHHDKHHGTYVKTLNALLAAAGHHPESLEAVIRSAGQTDRKLFNNAAQAWNHGFFWEAMRPWRACRPAISKQRSGPHSATSPGWVRRWSRKVAAHFGSGWVWLVADSAGALSVRSTHDAQNMVAEGGPIPLLVCDLWEHAYYLDYKNDRKAYLEAWFKAAPNWPFAGAQFAAATGQGEAWRYPAPIADDAKASHAA